MNEKATSDIEKRLERIAAEAEAAGIKVRIKITDPGATGKVKGAMIDLKDKIVELNIPSHIKSGAKTVKKNLIKLKDKCVETKDGIKERRELRRKIGTDIIEMTKKIDSVLERTEAIEEKLKKGK